MKAEGRSDLDNVQTGDLADNGGAQNSPAVRGLPTRTCCDVQPTILVSDNLPPIPSISDAELDAIERYMVDILNVVLGGAGMPPISERDNGSS